MNNKTLNNLSHTYANHTLVTPHDAVIKKFGQHGRTRLEIVKTETDVAGINTEGTRKWLGRGTAIRAVFSWWHQPDLVSTTGISIYRVLTRTNKSLAPNTRLSRKKIIIPIPFIVWLMGQKIKLSSNNKNITDTWCQPLSSTHYNKQTKNM